MGDLATLAEAFVEISTFVLMPDVVLGEFVAGFVFASEEASCEWEAREEAIVSFLG